MADNNTDREFSWDDPIEKDSEFIVLPEGDYDFVAEDFERGRYAGSEKLPACSMATVFLRIDTPEGKVTIRHRLYLHSRTEWGLSQFFTAIGLKKKGEKIAMDWAKVPGATGSAHITQRTYDGKTYNQVSKFLPKKEGASGGGGGAPW